MKRGATLHVGNDRRPLTIVDERRFGLQVFASAFYDRTDCHYKIDHSLPQLIFRRSVFSKRWTHICERGVWRKIDPLFLEVGVRCFYLDPDL